MSLFRDSDSNLYPRRVTEKGLVVHTVPQQETHTGAWGTEV